VTRDHIEQKLRDRISGRIKAIDDQMLKAYDEGIMTRFVQLSKEREEAIRECSVEATRLFTRAQKTEKIMREMQPSEN